MSTTTTAGSRRPGYVLGVEGDKNNKTPNQNIQKAMETIVVIQEEIKRKNKEIEDMMQREV